MSYIKQLKYAKEAIGHSFENLKKADFIKLLNQKFKPIESDLELVRKTYNFCRQISNDRPNSNYYTSIMRKALRNTGGYATIT